MTEPTATPSLERADDQPHEAPVEGTYIAPGGQAAGWKRAGSVAAGLGLLLTKAKTILAVLLGAKWFLIGAKLLGSSLSFVVSVWFYALFFGWKFAFVFTLLILVHECGHAIFMRAFGVPASLPYFIPGFGALITIKERPASVLAEAYIALGGPLVGSLAALACFAYGELTGEQFWIAAAYTGFFLNLFNLFPVMPLDGGRIAGAISPRIWLFGLGALGHRLLTCRAPFAKAASPLAYMLAVTAQDVDLPSHTAAAAGMDPPWVRELEGDLDAILTKALARDPARRYATAEQMQGDLHRHLDGLPVHARNPTVRYRTVKLAHRLANALNLGAPRRACVRPTTTMRRRATFT